MAIKRRFTMTPLRKELQALADLPGYGDAPAVLSKQGKLYATDAGDAENLAEQLEAVLTNAHFSESKREGVKGRLVLTEDERDAVSDFADKLKGLAISLSEEVEELKEERDAYRKAYYE